MCEIDNLATPNQIKVYLSNSILKMTSFVTLTKVYVIKCQENLAILAIEVFKLLIEKLRWLFPAISVIPASMLIYHLLNEWIKNIDLEKIIKLLVIWKNAVLSLTCSFFVQNVNFLTIYIKVTYFLWKIDQMAHTIFCKYHYPNI